MKTPPNLAMLKEKEPIDRPTKNDWENLYRELNRGIVLSVDPLKLEEILQI
jgi:hypothetical protein